MGVSGILTADRRDTLEYGEGAKADVTQVTDGCTDDVQRPWGGRVRKERRRPIRAFDREVGWRTGRVALARQTCSLNFASSAGRGTAPTTWSISFPSLKNRMVGMERTLNRAAVF